MRVGVPKEIKNNEFRVGMTPGAVREYVTHGHKVMVQTNAGVGIKASDDDYKAAGASSPPGWRGATPSLLIGPAA